MSDKSIGKLPPNFIPDTRPFLLRLLFPRRQKPTLHQKIVAVAMAAAEPGSALR